MDDKRDGDDGPDEDREEEVERTAEPDSMSWFVVAFMSMCLFMTAAMTYYAWGVFERAV